MEDFVKNHLCKLCVITSIARTTGLIWPHAGYTLSVYEEGTISNCRIQRVCVSIFPNYRN